MNALDPKDELDSRISTKKSLFEVELKTPKGSTFKAVNKQALTSGFSQTRKVNGNQSVYNQDPDFIINKLMNCISNKKKSYMKEVNDSYSVDSRSPPHTNDYLFKKSSVNRFFEPVHPAITQGTGFSIPYGADDDTESKAAQKKMVQEIQLRQI